MTGNAKEIDLRSDFPHRNRHRSSTENGTIFNFQPPSRKQVSGEMNQWERSGQWLFSSFTPLKSHPLLAGFSDLSPEELRIKAYEALKTNTSGGYVSSL